MLPENPNKKEVEPNTDIMYKSEDNFILEL